MDPVQTLLAMASETNPPAELLERWRESREQGIPLLPIWDFVLAVDAALTGDAKALAEFRTSVLGDLFRQLPAEAPARSDLLECAERWSATFLEPDMAEQLLPDWRSVTFPEGDPQTLELLLRIGDRVGLFARDTALDERIGQNALGPTMLDHPDWANAFSQALVMPGARDLWRGAMRAMTFQEADRLMPLESTLQRSDLTHELEALVLELQNPWLFSFLTVRRDLAEPLRAFSEGFGRVAEAFPDLARADLLRTAFMAAFADGAVSMQEALGAIALIETEGFGVAACGLLRDFEQILDREGKFDRPDVKQHELVAALARDLPATALASFPVIEAHAECWPQLATGKLTADELTHLAELLGKLQERSAATREKLLSFVANQLLNDTLQLEDASALPPEMLTGLREQHAKRQAQQPPKQAADWARAFGQARDLGLRFPLVADALLQDFEADFAGWKGPKNPWKAVSKALAAMRAADHHRDWKTRYADRLKRPPSRLMKVLKPIMAVILLAVVGLGLFIAVQRLGPALIARLSGLGVSAPQPSQAAPEPPATIQFVPVFDPGVVAPPGSTGRRFGSSR